MTQQTPTASDELQLSEDELRSALWMKLAAHFENKLIRYRKKNDGNLGTDDTARLRGRIAEVKEILALDTRTGSSDRD